MPKATEYVKETETLRIADRCDRCPAQAFAWARVIGVALRFCGHHFAKHRNALLDQASIIVDERHRINLKPTESE